LKDKIDIELSEAVSKGADKRIDDDAVIQQVENNVNSENEDNSLDNTTRRSGEHSHHHHHRHHSHKSRHKSSKSKTKKNNKKNEKFLRFVEKNKKYLIWVGVGLAFLLVLIVVGVIIDSQNNADDSLTDQSNPIVNAAAESLTVEIPFFTKEANLNNLATSELVNCGSDVSVMAIYKKHASAENRLDVGLPVRLSYTLKNVPGEYTVKSAEYVISESKDFKNPQVISTDGFVTKIDVYNLKTGTRYYYRIYLVFSNGTETEVGGSFKTANGPRILNLDGVYNARDIGGWTTTDGKVIKQGLLYRGCEVDGAIEQKYKVTQSSLNTMLTVLGIKTDIDLRLSTDNFHGTDGLGAGVKHLYYSAPMYSNIFNSEDNKEKIRAVFSDLAVESNYPIYLHCTYGTDRTGTVCYLLEALLGLDEESMMKDYLLSGLHHGGYVSLEEMNAFVEKLNSLPGNSMRDKVEGFLISIGVTEEEISNIRRIFLGE